MIQQLYYFRSYDSRGKLKRGLLYAQDLKALKFILQVRQRSLASAKPIHQWIAYILIHLLKVKKRYRISGHIKGIFFRELSNIIEAGSSLQKAVESMVTVEKNVLLLKTLTNLHGNLVLGFSLQQSIKGAFGFLGEEQNLLLSGCTDNHTLKNAFLAIAGVSEKKQNLTFSIIRMTSVFILSMVTTLFIFIFYVQNWMEDARKSFLYDQRMPPHLWETFYQLFSGEIFTHWRYLFVFAGIAGVICFIRFYRPVFHRWQRAMLKIPIIGEGVRTQLSAAIFYYLELQITAGVNLHTALAQAAFVMRHSAFAKHLQDFSRQIREGQNMTRSLEDFILFSDDEKSLLISSMGNKRLIPSLAVMRKYLDGKLRTRLIIVRELIRFTYLMIILVLYAWMFYTRLYVRMHYGY